MVDSIDAFAFDDSSMTIGDAGYSSIGSWINGIDAQLVGVEAIFYINQVSLYRCPADSFRLDGSILLGTHPSNDASIGTHFIPALGNSFERFNAIYPRNISNYVSNAGALGVTDTPSNPDSSGLWGPIRSRESDSLETVADGAANVILFAESLGHIDPNNPGFANLRQSGLGGLAIGRADRYGITNGANPFSFLGTAKKSHWMQFGSPHPDVVNALRADGTVQSVNRNIHPITFGRLCAVADGLSPFER